MIDDAADRRAAARLSKLFERRRLILVAASACAASALVVSLFMPRLYRATTFILVSESRLGESYENTNLQQMAMLPTFLPFVDSDTLIVEALGRLGLDRPPYSLTLDSFRRHDYLEVRTPKSTRLLELRVEFPDPEIAAALANELAVGAVRFNDRLNGADMTAAQAYLRKQVERAMETQTEAAASRLTILEEARIEDREKELQILLDEKEQLSVRLGQLRLALVQSESRAASLDAILEAEPEVISLTKSVISDPILSAALGTAVHGDAPLSVREESINETREAIRRSLVSASVDLTADRDEMAAVSQRLTQVNDAIADLSGHVTGLRTGIEAANQDYQLAVEATQSASREYQTASVNVGSKTLDMKQISPALPPEHPARPQLITNTLAGFLLGILISGAGVIAFQGYRDFASD